VTFDLVILKVVSESSVTWATTVPILVFLGLSVLDLGPMYAQQACPGDVTVLVSTPIIAESTGQGGTGHGSQFLPRDGGIRKHSLCCRPVSVCLSVLPSVRHVGGLYPDG